MTDETTAQQTQTPASAPPALDVAAAIKRLRWAATEPFVDASKRDVLLLLDAYAQQTRELEAARNDATQKREELAEVIAEFGQFKRETSSQRSDFYNRLEASRRENKTRSLWYGDHHPQCEKEYSREGSTRDCAKFGCLVDAARAGEPGAEVEGSDGRPQTGRCAPGR